MKISVLQQKFRPGSRMGEDGLPTRRAQAAARLEDTFAMLEEAGRRGSDLAVTIEAVNDCLNCADTRWPFSEVYEGIDGPTVRCFAGIAKRWRMHVVAGLYLAEGGRAYNCAVLFDGEGEIIGVHRKAHLLAGEERQITPGSRLDVFDTRLGRIGMLVCWDLQFPEAARIQALKGAELIAVPTLGWENRYGLCRAYENSVTIAAAMGVGAGGPLPDFCDPSCVVDNMGRIVAAAGRDGSEVVTCYVDIRRDPDPQYGSQAYIDSDSMRKTRFLQRRPALYGMLSEATEAVPLYARYFHESAEEERTDASHD